jgi:HD domain-containing protein
MTDPTPLLVSRRLAASLLRLYDYPDPRNPNRTIRGYDGPHALRTARMCAAVALHLGHPPARVKQYQVACLLHDLGRSGLDRRLFGRIWSWARQHGIPTRPREWRAVHPRTRYGREPEAFVTRYGAELERAGIRLDAWAREQIEMRLGYARRLDRQLRRVKPALIALGVSWRSWMKLVMLYYYYPEKLRGRSRWVRQLSQVLVACEQFEAYSNRRRGRDYYVRTKEDVRNAFAYLEKLQAEGILDSPVVRTIKLLAAEGAFTTLLAQARGCGLSRREQTYLRMLKKESACR